MPFDYPRQLTVSAHGEAWALAHDVVYRGARDDFTVPAGFVTDFATVPAVVTWLVPRAGAHTLAAVLHDWTCTEGIRTGAISSRDADGLFRRTMRELGVPPVRRWLAWAGVRWGALASDLRRPGWWRDAPAVLALSVLALPVVAPATVLAAAGLAVYHAAELLARALGRR